MTLHEMATGNLPRWGDGSADPLLVDEEVTVDAEWFDPSVRDPLAEFFARALARDYRSRFDSAEAMCLAWSGCFEAIDMQTAGDEEGRDLPGDLDGVTRETPLLALGLSPRLLNALDRLGAHTVAQLVGLPPYASTATRGSDNASSSSFASCRSVWRSISRSTDRPSTPRPPSTATTTRSIPPSGASICWPPGSSPPTSRTTEARMVRAALGIEGRPRPSARPPGDRRIARRATDRDSQRRPARTGPLEPSIAGWHRSATPWRRWSRSTAAS